MTSTVLDIYNAALSAVHAKGRLSSLTQNSREREECDIWYPIVRDQVQEAAYWPGCRVSKRLALVASRDGAQDWMQGDPENQYQYSYDLPSDYLRAWHLSNYAHFTISFDNERGTRVINTNQPQALLIYARRQDNVIHWTPGQKNATIHALAAMIVGPLSRNNQSVNFHFGLANEAILQARSHAANAQTFVTEVMPPALQARGYMDTLGEPRYYYPFESLFGSSSN